MILRPVEKRLQALKDLAAFYRRQLKQPTKKVFDPEGSGSIQHRFKVVKVNAKDREEWQNMVADCEREIEAIGGGQ